MHEDDEIVGTDLAECGEAAYDYGASVYCPGATRADPRRAAFIEREVEHHYQDSETGSVQEKKFSPSESSAVSPARDEPVAARA